MPSRIAATLALLVGVCLVARADESETSYKALVKSHDDAIAAYQKAFAAAKTDAERAKAFETKHPRDADYAAKFMALAAKFPDGKAAADCLVWVVIHPLDAASEGAGLRAKALAALAKDHADDDRAGSLCTRLVRSVDAESEAFLRAVREKAKKKPVQARACASLAVNLRHRARLIPVLTQYPENRKRYESAFGKATVAALIEQDAKKLAAESEKLFSEVAEKFGDLPHPSHGKMELFAKRNLSAMRAPVTADRAAPPIIGEDVAGKKMTLADFKGNVVLLDFWGDGFAPCRAAYAYERGLAARMKGKPFVLLGINGDFDREAARKTMTREKLTWRSWHDGGTGGPIATRWDVEVWPTVVLIDHKGIVRHVFVGWPEAKKLDTLVDGLVAAAR